jgi:hypothetical protein
MGLLNRGKRQACDLCPLEGDLVFKRQEITAGLNNCRILNELAPVLHVRSSPCSNERLHLSHVMWP